MTEVTTQSYPGATHAHPRGRPTAFRVVSVSRNSQPRYVPYLLVRARKSLLDGSGRMLSRSHSQQGESRKSAGRSVSSCDQQATRPLAEP